MDRDNSVSLAVERKGVWGKQQQQKQQQNTPNLKTLFFFLEPHRWNSAFPSSRCANGEGQGQISFLILFWCMGHRKDQTISIKKLTFFSEHNTTDDHKTIY